MAGQEPAVSFNSRQESVSIRTPVSITGMSTVTGGTETSWTGCCLAFGLVGSVIGICTLSVGLWDLTTNIPDKTQEWPLLLILGLVILGSGLVPVLASCAWLCLCRKQKRKLDEGRLVLVSEEEEVMKKVTV